MSKPLTEEEWEAEFRAERAIEIDDYEEDEIEEDDYSEESTS